MLDINKIKAMTVEERLQLIEIIWQTLDEENIQEDEEELNMLQKVWEEYQADPSKKVSFEEFKNRMLKKYNGGKEL